MDIILDDLASFVSQANVGWTPDGQPGRHRSRHGQPAAAIRGQPRGARPARRLERRGATARLVTRCGDYADAGVFSQELDSAVTAALQRAASSAELTLHEVLLGIISVALQRTFRRRPSPLIDVESHGRVDIGAGLEVSRTMGWFTSVYPVALGSHTEPLPVLSTIRDAIRQQPWGGLDARCVVDYRADVLFNFFGTSAPASQAISAGSVEWRGQRCFRRPAPPVSAGVPGSCYRRRAWLAGTTLPVTRQTRYPRFSGCIADLVHEMVPLLDSSQTMHSRTRTRLRRPRAAARPLAATHWN